MGLPVRISNSGSHLPESRYIIGKAKDHKVELNSESDGVDICEWTGK